MSDYAKGVPMRVYSQGLVAQGVLPPKDLLSSGIEERATDCRLPFQGKQVAVSEEQESDTARERIEALLEKMRPQKKVLIDILAYCVTQKTVSSTYRHIDGLQKSARSVYNAASLCSLLEKAEGLVRVDKDGRIIEGLERQPAIIEEDGSRRLEAAEAEQGHWKSTDAAILVVDAHRPDHLLEELLLSENQYLPIYRTILEACSMGGGAALARLQELIDDHVLAQEPRRFTSYYVERLEGVGALTWDALWKTTDAGSAALERSKKAETDI